MTMPMKNIYSAIALISLSVLFSSVLPAQDAKSVPAKKKTVEIKQIPPVKAYITMQSVKYPVELIGRSDKKILARDKSKEIQYNVSEIESVDFRVDMEEYKVQELVARKKWEDAASMIIKAFLPTFPYIDLNDNNSAEYLLDAAAYIVKAAREDMLKSPPGKISAEVEKKFTNAYKVFKQVEKAEWYPGAKTAQMKAVQCLIFLGNGDKAAEVFEEIGEPELGDLSYGLYYMIYGTILYDKKNVKEALAAGIKSVVFDTKDLDSFPDALIFCGKCYEDLLDYHRARDVYFETSKLFQKTEWGDDAFRKLKFLMDKGLTKKQESVDIEKVFFDSEEDVNAKVEAFIKQKEEQDKLDKEKQKEEDEAAKEEEKKQEELKKEQKKQEEEAEKVQQ